MAGAKSGPVKNNYAGCQQLQRLFQHTPMLQQTAQHTQISPQNQSESQSEKKKKTLNLQRVCWSLSTRTSTDFYPMPFTRLALCKAAQQGVHSELITFELGVECLQRPRQASEGKTSTSWLCCFSSSHSGRGWKNSARTHSHAQIKTACCHD